jgi:hypothetical protein
MRFVLLALLGSATAYADPSGSTHPSGTAATVVTAKPIPATLADVIPTEGLYLASYSEHVNDEAHDEMFIARLDRSGLREVYRSPRWTSDPHDAGRGRADRADPDITDPGTGRDKPWQQVRRACTAQPMEDFRLLRPRIWAEKVRTPPTPPDANHITYWSEEWRISIDDTVIGAVGGSSWTIAISPPR